MAGTSPAKTEKASENAGYDFNPIFKESRTLGLCCERSICIAVHYGCRWIVKLSKGGHTDQIN